MKPEIRCIVGLGNPGEQYAATRHNIGWMITDALLEKFRGVWRAGKGKFLYSPIRISGRQIYLIRCTTFMNNSGVGVIDAMERLEIAPSELLVIFDDFSLPFGTIRIRKSGSDGGHNGMASIIYLSGTQKIPRMRIGIGSVPENTSPVDFVLDEFKPNEKKMLPDIIKISVEAVVLTVIKGIDSAMERFNRKGKAEKSLLYSG